MPFVVSNKQKIYYELAGDKGPWMILHGPHMIPMNAWKDVGYLKYLEKDFRLVLVEPIGQGFSDAPTDSSHYTISSRIRHILDILRELQADYSFFFGIGIGAQVGFLMTRDFPRRIRALISIDSQPYQELDEIKHLKEKINLLNLGKIEEYIEKWHSKDNLTEDQKKIISQGNSKAYALSIEASINWEGLGDDLKSIGTAILLFTSKSENRFLSVRDAGKRLRNGRYIILPEDKRSNGLFNPELIIEALLEFTRRDRSN